MGRKGAVGTIYRRPGRTIWMMQYYKNGALIRESSQTPDERTARKMLAARVTDLDRGVPVPAVLGKITFEEGETLIVTDYENNAHDSLDDMTRRIRLHLRPWFGGRRLADLTPTDVEAYKKARRDAGASNGTINRELAVLKRLLNLAVQQGRLVHRTHVAMLVEKNVRSGFFEPAAFAAVRRHLPAPIQPVVTFAYVTGWRIDSEVLPLEWRQVDFAAGTVVLDAGMTKNGEPRVFPLTDDLRALLELRARERDAVLATGVVCPLVFFRLVATKRGGAAAASVKRPKRITRFNKAWAAATRRAGVPGRLPHDFRRTAVRDLVRLAVPERVAMQLTGHLTRSVFERYNIVSPGDLRDAAGKLAGKVARATGAPSVSESGMITSTITSSAIESGDAIEKPEIVKDFGGAGRS